MAHQMTDRELRNLRRNQLIAEQERQRKIDEEIVYLQSQREQHISEQRYRRQLLARNEDEGHLEDRSRVIGDRHADSSVSSLNNPVFESEIEDGCRENMHTQVPRSILKKTPSAVHGNVRPSEAEQEMKQSNVGFARRLTYSQEHERGEITRDLRSMAMSIEDDDFGLIDQCDRHSQGSVQYRREESFGQDDSVNLVQIERVGSGRVQPPSFLNSTDRGIDDLDRRLETLLTSGSEILEKSREMMNRTSVADLVKDESLTSAKEVSKYMGDGRTRYKDRIEHEKNRRISYSQENRMQFIRMDSDRRLQDYSVQRSDKSYHR